MGIELIYFDVQDRVRNHPESGSIHGLNPSRIRIHLCPDGFLTLIQGRATIIRIMLKMAGISFLDTRIKADKEVWKNEKTKIENLALGQLPVLKIDDQVYCQQDAIEEYCAIRAGIVPNDPADAMRVKMLLGMTHKL